MVMRESQEIRATNRDGVFLPSEPVELEDGCEVTVSVSGAAPVAATESGGSASPPSDQSEHVGTRLLAMVEELKRKYPPESREPIPPDSAMNYKHYLYGHPKEAERSERW